jgi:hypothetical protein
MSAAFEIARLFRHDPTIFARGSQVALAMENIAVAILLQQLRQLGDIRDDPLRLV